jgi:hypothetical protein
MGTIVLFEPESIRGRVVQLLDDDVTLQTLTTDGWECIGIAVADSGHQRFILARPRALPLARIKLVRRLLGIAFAEGAKAASAWIKLKSPRPDFDPVEAGEKYATAVELPDEVTS